jgi:hypothetical protein
MSPDREEVAMHVRRSLGFAVIAGLLVTGPRPASACCMVPATWNGDVDQAEQNVVVLHHGGHEDLILRVAPFFQTKADAPLAADAEPPPYLEWVVTVPSPPTDYGVVPASVFRDVDALASRLVRLASEQEAARTKWEWPEGFTLSSKGVDGAVASAAGTWDALDVGPLVRVGPYEITPVKARGREALDALNAYLAGRGYPQEDPDHMAWFVERGFTFLCIHVTPPPGAARLGERLDLEPLRIAFASDRPYYPAKFSSRQGAFALSLATITARPLARRSIGQTKERLEARGAGRSNLFTVKALPGSLPGATPAEVERWYVNVFRSEGFNRVGADGRPAIASWTDDVFFELGGDADEPPGWYYGDRDLWFPERLVREHGIAIGVWGVLGAGIAFRFRRRKARSRSAAGPRVPGAGSA